MKQWTAKQRAAALQRIRKSYTLKGNEYREAVRLFWKMPAEWLERNAKSWLD